MKVELQVIIHQTPAALRFGGDGYFVTFAGTEADKAEAAKLLLLNGMPLKVTVEVDEKQVNDGNEAQSESESERKDGGRQWLRRKRAQADG